jgi:hypothetical protein
MSKALLDQVTTLFLAHLQQSYASSSQTASTSHSSRPPLASSLCLEPGKSTLVRPPLLPREPGPGAPAALGELFPYTSHTWTRTCRLEASPQSTAREPGDGSLPAEGRAPPSAAKAISGALVCCTGEGLNLEAQTGGGTKLRPPAHQTLLQPCCCTDA